VSNCDVDTGFNASSISQHRKTFSSVLDELVIDDHHLDDMPAAISHASSHVYRSLTARDDSIV
jgi:hypothetical protein